MKNLILKIILLIFVPLINYCAEEINYDKKLLQAALYGYQSSVEEALKNGANIDARIDCIQDNQSTALHLAAGNGRSEVVNVLIKYKATVNAINKKLWMPLHRAARGGNINIVNALIDAKAAIDFANSENETPLLLAAKFNNYKIVDALISAKAKVDLKDKNLNSPLHWAARLGKIDKVNSLINAKANINVRNNGQRTPLHLAAAGKNNRFYDHTSVVKALICAKADIDVEDDKLYTPLHYAAKSGCAEIIHALLKAGADTTLIIKDNRTNFDSANFKIIEDHLTIMVTEIVKLFFDLRQTINIPEPIAILITKYAYSK